MANATLYILGEDMTLQPVGVPGEAYLGGAGLATGYVNRADLTAERFVADPIGPPGARLYKSGDRLRWCPGGVVEFLGRTDFQVKIRGYRVEPGEIEQALLTHPAICHAVVTARADSAGELVLVAYVVGRSGSSFNTHDLRAPLNAACPHMVPAACVRLDSLPLNPNGRTDRQGLPRRQNPPTKQPLPSPRARRRGCDRRALDEISGASTSGETITSSISAATHSRRCACLQGCVDSKATA